MESTIEIDRLRLFAHHGVFEYERENGNFFELTIRLRYPVAKAMESDNIDDTLNYALAVEIVKEEMQTPSRLLEHAVGRIHARLMDRFPEISGGMISLTKLNPPIPEQIAGVTVKIEW
ncbi:MAG: dihydroneopterin aldolase [Staphylococcus sp.]|nr:dihydroneopterin aldolase [Staphylococcus sp.]